MTRKVKLKDVCREITVGHVGPMADEYVECGIPFLRSQNILPFRLDESDIKFINQDFHNRLKKSALAPGDVLVVRTGYPGTACVLPERPTLIHGRTAVFLIDRPQLLKELIFILLAVVELRSATRQELMPPFTVADNDVIRRVLESVLTLTLHCLCFLLQQPVQNRIQLGYRYILQDLIAVSIGVDRFGTDAIEVARA